jgi:hypothetical protein
MADDETAELTLKQHHSTDKAYLLSDSGDEKDAKWVPKSQVVGEPEVKNAKKGVFEFTIKTWIAKKNGWV